MQTSLIDAEKETEAIVGGIIGGLEAVGPTKQTGRN